MSDGLRAASRPDVTVVVCDLAGNEGPIARLGQVDVPCPMLLRHDLGRGAIDALYDVAGLDADVRPSFRAYDDLRRALTDGRAAGDNATRAILRGLGRNPDARLRDFVAVMAVLGERPVMQADVARAMAMSPSSFRAWLGVVRRRAAGMPSFPRLNAHFVALHLLWRRERLGWSGKRSAAAASFTDDKACANYLRYHLGATGGGLLRAGGFDARMTATRQLFASRERRDEVRRI